MILCKLKLENFKKYTSFEIEFSEGLVGIIGKNGSGKSTIFEAILFALYGEFKDRGYKDIVRNANATSKDAVLVELSFEFEEFEYLVIREFRGKALSANAKLFKNSELISSGAKDVSTSIIKLTKMNKEAFLHTLFASQKELTSLSTSKPEDRKRMIRKLLGLEKIDFIEKELVEKSRELKREISAFAEVLLSNEEVENKKKSIEEHKKKEEELEKCSFIYKKEIDSLKLYELDIKKELEVYAKTKEQKVNLYSKIELLKNTINSHIQTKDKLSEEIKVLEKKQNELKGLQNIKQEYTSLHESIIKQEKLKEYYLRKEGLLKEQISLREQYIKSKESISILEFETKEHNIFLENAKIKEQKQIELKNQLQVLYKEEKKQFQEIAGEEKLIADINQKIENIHNLGRESNCPTCTRPLLDEYDNVLSSLDMIVKQRQKEKIDKSKEELELIENRKTKLEKELKQVDKEYLELSKSINLCESKKRDLQKESEHFEKITIQGKKNKEELAKLENYSYDKDIHQNLLDKQKELKIKYEYILSLETMLKRLDGIKEEELIVNKNIEKYTKEFEEKELEYKTINYDEQKHKQKQNEFEINIKQKEEKINLLNEQKIQIATIQGQIKTIKQSLENNDKQVLKVEVKKDDLIDYEKIKISLAEFKTKLNSSIAPRISEIASTMYAQITKGKYQNIEVSNDFDFYIYDEGKKYTIERYSGGEIDLANLVLRIAISKTLSELNGANTVGFLAFDEVFGSQDELRRMEILEAFHMIKEQYRQIFLISHEMEIKEMFEHVVEL